MLYSVTECKWDILWYDRNEHKSTMRINWMPQDYHASTILVLVPRIVSAPLRHPSLPPPPSPRPPPPPPPSPPLPFAPAIQAGRASVIQIHRFSDVLIAWYFCFSWIVKLLVTPSNLVFLTGIGLLSICAFTGLIILLLHLKEKVSSCLSRKNSEKAMLRPQ